MSGSPLRARSERGQTLVLLAGAAFVLVFGVSVLGAFGSALLERGRQQRAVDLAAISGARSMRDDFERLFEPARDSRGFPNQRHLEKSAYLARAKQTALEIASSNGVEARSIRVGFPDGRSFAPVRIRVTLAGSGTAEAELSPPADGTAAADAAGGYSGPLAYRQGKPMRPDVALAFDRLQSAARKDGLALIISSAYRSDAEQARLFVRHPDPRWVAPPGKSLHRNATELDLGPPAAYGWLERNAGRFGFQKRYAWEPWHYGYTLNARSTPDLYRSGRARDGGSAVPDFVPAGYADVIARAASRWNVAAALLAAQLYTESNFNPFAVSRAGAQGIAQFMPATARALGLDNPFDAAASISVQAHLMRDLLRRFGSVALALAAYNAGPGAVERHGGIPPYPETRAYVARILGLMNGAGALEAGSTGTAEPGLEVHLVS